MNTTLRIALLFCVVVTLQFAAEISNATIVQVPPINWVFQNTQDLKATDVHISIRGSPGLFIDPRSSGGAPFPNGRVGTVGDDFFGRPYRSAIFQGPPGIPAGGSYGLSFPGWPVGTQFDVLFSYNNEDLDVRSPGRVYQQLGFGLDPTDFDFVADLSSEPFAPLAADFDFLSSSGRIVAISEPATLALLSLGLAVLFFRTRGQA